MEKILRTCVSTLALCFIAKSHPSPRMDNYRFLDDQTIVIELLNVTPRISQRNFVNFVRIQPDFVFSALQNVRRQALLEF
jgi:hypothetical protein